MPTGIDVDNTIAVTDTAALQRLNRRFGTRYNREQLRDHNVERALKLSPEQVAFIRGIFEDEEFYLRLPCLKRAVEGVNTIAEADDVVYITARPEKFADVTVCWLSDRGFPVGELVCGVEDKGLVALEYGCEACIEDYPSHALQIVARGIPVYMILCPWNRDFEHPLVTKMRNWGEIIALLQEG